VDCEFCNRDNVIKAYCYWSNRPISFLLLFDEEFTVDSFAAYAIDARLSWKLAECNGLSIVKAREVWCLILPSLKEALQEALILEGLSDVKN